MGALFSHSSHSTLEVAGRMKRRAAIGILVVIFTTAGSAEAKCSTTNGETCVFPFIDDYNDLVRLYRTCTTADGAHMPWCATKVDSDGYYMEEKGVCSSDCPGVADRKNHYMIPMYVHPENAVGNCKCGVPNTMRGSSRIDGGKDVMNGEFPWQVALLDGPTPSDQHCEGTLVSDRHVVTAAHCIENIDNRKPKVLIGDTTLAIANDTTRFIAQVSKVILHPDYHYPDNNIAVLTLSRPLDLHAYPNIKPACLPWTETVEDLKGKPAIASGYGDMDMLQHAHLQKVEVEIFGKNNCLCQTDNRFCAGAMRTSSGGPLVAKNDKDNNGAATLVGVSQGKTCNSITENYPGAYADVAHYMQNGWLSNLIRDGQKCAPPKSSDWSLGSS